MKTTDPRDLTWQEIRGQLAGTRETIHAWMLANGPATTEAIARGTGIGLLTVRPRVSELAAWGLAECTGRARLGGIYKAIETSTAQARHEAARHEGQLNLLL